MLKRLLFVSACAGVALNIFAQEDKDVKADSIVYEKPKEWRIYSAGAPVTAFTLTRDQIWYSTADQVFCSSLKKVEVQKYPTLGTIPGSGVKCMATDVSGKAWIGGLNGIAVKNGTQFTVYTSENGLPDNNVNAMVVGKDGKVWVGTDNGVAVFSNGAWTVYTKAQGLSSNKCQAMTVDSKGDIWIGTDKGISVFDGVKWTIHDMKKGLSWNDVKALSFDPRTGNIWAAVGESDVNCYEKGTWKTYMQIQPGIVSIMADSQSRIWFGSQSGLIKFNGDEWVSDPKALGVPAAQVSCMYKDESGNLWYAMESGVLKMANPYPF